jgi:general secretion pathway protein A
MLARPELEQLAQRVIARYHLGPLSVEETGAYAEHRLAVAGAHAGTPIPAALAPLIHRLTGGVPRRVNLLCDRALLGAYVENSAVVTPRILRRAAQEVFAGEAKAPGPPLRWPLVAGGVLAGAAISAAAWQAVPHRTAPAPEAKVAHNAGAAPAKPAAPKPAVSKAAEPAAAKPLALATEEEALRELGELWGQKLPAGEPCAAAPRLGLRCYQGRGGLYELRLLDRPAIVALHDGPRLGYALLTAMDEQGATLTIKGQRQKVSLGALATRFDGAFTTLWKAPRGFRDEVRPGDAGPDVDWIAAQLAGIDDDAVPRSGQPMSDATRRLLRAFQEKQNLKADGVAGPRTYMRLNQLGGVDEPRLLAASGAK